MAQRTLNESSQSLSREASRSIVFKRTRSRSATSRIHFLQNSSFWHLCFQHSLIPLQKLTKRRSAPAAMSKGASSSTKAMGVAQSKSELPVDPSLGRLQAMCAQFSFACATCKAPLEVEIQPQFEAWRAGSQTIPPKSQLSSMQCSLHEDHFTCAGCGKIPGFSDDNIFTSLGVVNHCCDLGRLFGIWFLLSRFDEAQLQQPAQTAKKGMEVFKKSQRMIS